MNNKFLQHFMIRLLFLVVRYLYTSKFKENIYFYMTCSNYQIRIVFKNKKIIFKSQKYLKNEISEFNKVK